MEPWEVSHIQRNKFDLQQLTICNTLFRAVLQEHGVLGGNDISLLEAVQNSKGIHAESELLYNILLRRERAFNALVDACERTKQTGALNILKRGRLEYIQSHFTNWDELSDDLKIEMGNKLVDFQGKKVMLSECCNHLHHLIDGKFLSELAKGNTPTLVGNQVPDQLQYYIQRTLRSRNRLKSSFFQQPCDDVFVVEGLEKYELTSLVAGARTDVSGNQIERLTVRYILLEYEGDFERICKLTRFPVHFIRHKDNIYEWVKSSGSVKTLQMHVDDVQDDFNEEQLASRGNRVNVIPDSPGMGKTHLLANIAHQISKHMPDMLIRFLVMKDVVQALSKKPINLQLILSFIAEKSSEFEVGRKMVENTLTSDPSILMFDGFDEVPLHHIDIAKQILSAITTLKSAQIFVTTRPHLRRELENLLNVLGYTINPFTKSDQVNFLLNFWKMKGAAENEALKQYATECVNTIGSNMTDFERDVAGIPLQCRLLAECYTEHALRCSEIGAAPSNSKPLGQINSIFEMYEMHTKMRLEKICEDSMMKRIAVRLFIKQSKVEEIKYAHMYYALELLFREHVHQFQFLKTTSISINELCAAGFLEVTNSESVQFVHRTFAEFFVAWFAVEMKMPEKKTPFLPDELLATKPRKKIITTPFGKVELGNSHTFSYPVIAYFINGFSKVYSKNQEDLNQSSRVSLLMNSVHYGQVSRIFLASAVGDYQFVPLLVSLCFESWEICEKDNSDILKLLLISAKYSSVALVNTLCSQLLLTKLKSPFKIGLVELTPLHVAVQRGHYQLVEFLAGKYALELKNLRCLLHFCVFKSLKDNKETVADKLQIIRLLSRKSDVCLSEKLGDGKVPLLQKDVNCELIKCLIECGADVNVLDEKGNSILHKITENPVTPEFYHWLVVSVNERNFIHFDQQNPTRKQVRPLHCALEKVELLKDTLKYFQLNRVDFNVEDERKESPLFYAIRGGRSLFLIRTLIELGADWKKKNRWQNTVLDICAQYGHYHAMKYFVETLKMDVNAKDRDGETPLHYAVQRRSKDYELMQQFLVKSGADVNARCNTGFTPLIIGLRDGEGLSLSTIQLMEEHGLSVGEEQASKAIEYFLSNSNIKSWENVDEFIGVLQFLIEKGGVIQDIPYFNRSTIIWNTTGVQRHMRAIIQSTDLDCLWPHLETSGLLTKSELKDIQNHSADSFKKCERFYELLVSKNESFERVCTLLSASSQMVPLTLLRQSLYSALLSDEYMFLSPPTLTSQFLHSPMTSNSNTMALVTTNSFLTIERIRETISEEVVEIKEADVSSYLQKQAREDIFGTPYGNGVIVLKVRVVTSELISNLETSKAAQCKIIFVCSAVDEDVQNCHVITDSLPAWEDISTQYFKHRARFYVVGNGLTPIFELFKSPLILNKLSQLNWITEEFLDYDYSVERYKMGHNDLEFQSKGYLCPTIFHYALPDKLVFHGIPIEKLKESARFGHKIGTFGKDYMDDLDYVLIENSQQFDEICRRTSANVHLIEYVHEMGVFKLTRTFGWNENIQGFLKQQLCEGFPHCDCAPVNENLVVGLLTKASYCSTIHRFECVLPINELTPKTLKIMKLEYAEELFNVRALLKRMCGKLQVILYDFIGQPYGVQIVQLVTEHFSTLLIENELHNVAINTLCPILNGETNGIEGLEKYEKLGMLKQTNNQKMVFVDKSLALYFIAKLFMGLPETINFEEITAALRKKVLQNCFECKYVEITSRYVCEQVSVCVNSPSQKLSSYKFINIFCFRFINALLKKTSDRSYASFSNFLRSIVAVEPEGYKWIHACVNSNLFNLLQLILSFKDVSLSSALDLDKLFVLAVNYADAPITRLMAEQFEKKMKRKLTEIKVYHWSTEISMVSLAAKRGNYGVVKYLLNDQGFRHQLENQDQLRKVISCCLEYTSHISKYEVNERKRIVDLFLSTDVMVLQRILPSLWNVHVDLIVYLISLGADIHAKDEDNKNILHCCPHHLTPLEYHEVVSLIHAKDSTSIARLFKDSGSYGKAAFSVAVEHLELLDETIDLFSEAQVDFNALNEDGDSVFVRAVKCLRSARLLDALYRSGADIHAKDGEGDPASYYCSDNQTALRCLSSRGVAVNASDEDDDDDSDSS